MDYFHTGTKEPFGQDIVKRGTDLHLELEMTLTVKVEVLILVKLSDMYRSDSYVDKTTSVTRQTY
jgi:hypothetical protein